MPACTKSKMPKLGLPLQVKHGQGEGQRGTASLLMAVGFPLLILLMKCCFHYQILSLAWDPFFETVKGHVSPHYALFYGTFKLFYFSTLLGILPGSPWYRKVMMLLLKPTCLSQVHTHKHCTLGMERKMLAMWFSSLQSFLLSILCGPQMFELSSLRATSSMLHT